MFACRARGPIQVQRPVDVGAALDVDPHELPPLLRAGQDAFEVARRHVAPDVDSELRQLHGNLRLQTSTGDLLQHGPVMPGDIGGFRRFRHVFPQESENRGDA